MGRGIFCIKKFGKIEYCANIISMTTSMEEIKVKTAKDKIRENITNRVLLCVSMCIVTIGLYFVLGFFLDAWAESIPILLLPVLPSILVFRYKKTYKTPVVIFTTIVLLFGAFCCYFGVGLKATSKPGYGDKIKTGKVETINYSRSFMKDNYDIDQKAQLKVWLPEDYDSSKKYPVMFVIDGDNLFKYTATTASILWQKGYGDIIIVGIGYGYWNSLYARGAIVHNKNTKLRGRWRDYYFADDTQIDAAGNEIGGANKRAKEYTDFISKTVVPDIRSKYSVDNANSTIFGYDFGGYLAQYFLTQYRPTADTPFTNFVIVDSEYLDYYNAHLDEFKNAIVANDNKTYSTVKTYRIWGGDVKSSENANQVNTYHKLNNFGFEGLENYVWIPRDVDHSEALIIGLDEAVYLTLGFEFWYTEI